VPGHARAFAVGDIANIPYGDEGALPQLGSVAQQSGTWAAKNILGDINGSGREPFHYRDKGIMAMIGRKAAVAELRPHRHEMHGRLAFAGLARRARRATRQRWSRSQGIRGMGRGLLRTATSPFSRVA
jgi:NADH dehydrogenase FAD-containing subunit